MMVTPLIKEARNIVYNNLKYYLNQLNDSGQLKAIHINDLPKFKLESEVQILDSYQLVLRHEEKTITVFIKSLSQPDGIIQIEIS